MRIRPTSVLTAAIALLAVLSMATTAKSSSIKDPYCATPGPIPPTYSLGTNLGHPNCMDIDEFGRLYVFDDARQELMRFSLDGTLEKRWQDEGPYYITTSNGRDEVCVVPGELIFMQGGSKPDIRRIGPYDSADVTFKFDGMIVPTKVYGNLDGSFVIDSIIYDKPGDWDVVHHERRRYSPQGKMLSIWKSKEYSGFEGPTGLFYRYKITEISKNNNHVDLIITNRNNKLINKIDLDSLHVLTGSIKVDTNGDIYFVGDSIEDEIVRLSQNGQVLARWNCYRDTTDTSKDYRLKNLAVRNGLIYAIIYKTRRMKGENGSWNTFNDSDYEIQAFTPGGQCVARYTNKRVPLQLPTAIAVQPDGGYVVRQNGLDSLLVFDKDGNQTNRNTSLDLIEYIVSRPSGGYVYTDWYTIKSMDPTGSLRTTIYKQSAPTDVIKDPHAIAIDPSTGHIWGASFKSILFEYDSNGKLIRQLPELQGYKWNSASMGMAVDPKGFIYISCIDNQILKVDFNGKLVAKFGKKGSKLGKLYHPTALLLDNADHLFVLDSGNSRVQVFSTDGISLGFWGKHGSGDGELDRPLGMAFGPNNMLWISDTHNDRIIRVAVDTVLGRLNKEYKPEPVTIAAKPEPIPAPGIITRTGIITAGSEDFTDFVYMSDPFRAWGMRVTLPQGNSVLRGEKCRLTGKLELIERASKHLMVSSIERLGSESVPRPLGMANLYVGDGYRSGSNQKDLSNLGLLIKTWGKVVSVDQPKGMFVINDGSYPAGSGLYVYTGNLVSPIYEWPMVGQYVAVTGISINWMGNDGSNTPGLRIRNQEDIQVLKED